MTMRDRAALRLSACVALSVVLLVAPASPFYELSISTSVRSTSMGTNGLAEIGLTYAV